MPMKNLIANFTTQLREAIAIGEKAVLTPSKLASFLVEVVTFPLPLTLLQPQEEIVIIRVTAITAAKMRFIIFCFTG